MNGRIQEDSNCFAKIFLRAMGKQLCVRGGNQARQPQRDKMAKKMTVT